LFVQQKILAGLFYWLSYHLAFLVNSEERVFGQLFEIKGFITGDVGS
jgi:hypothetical protein